jgi:hypothetical protein
MNSSLALATETPLYLDPQILKKLHTYDDFLSTYIQLEQATSSFSWLKADLLNELTKREGERGVELLARDIKQPRSTVGNYVRTARAFPAENRIVNASFTLHFQASFADPYNPKTGGFDGDRRFEWIEKAVDNSWSTRLLAEYIKEEKRLTNPGNPIECFACEKTAGEIGLFVIFSASLQVREEVYLHLACFAEWVKVIIPEN